MEETVRETEGELVSGWKNTTLGEVINLKRGYDLPNKTRRSGKVPIVSSSGISGYHVEAKVQPPGVVTGRYGTLGEVFYVTTPFWPLNTTLYVEDFKGNHPYFISYFLKTLDLAGLSAAAAVPGLNRNHLHLLPVNLPPLPIQKKIAAVLSAYDDLIENNERRIKILEEMAQNLYREWFVNFRFPGHENVKLVDSPLGKIPEGWKVVALGSVVSVFRGRSYKSSELVDEGSLPFINLKCIDRDGGYRASGLKRYNGPFKEQQVAEAGDILMAVTDMTQERRIIARAARVPRSREPRFIYSMDLVKIVPKKTVPIEYLYGMLRHSSFPHVTKEFANGANVLHLSPDRITEYSFALPTKSVMDSFSAAYSQMLEMVDNLLLHNISLRQTRDLLLPKLVSGQLDVSEIDIETPEAAA